MAPNLTNMHIELSPMSAHASELSHPSFEPFSSVGVSTSVTLKKLPKSAI